MTFNPEGSLKFSSRQFLKSYKNRSPFSLFWDILSFEIETKLEERSVKKESSKTDPKILYAASETFSDEWFRSFKTFGRKIIA